MDKRETQKEIDIDREIGYRERERDTHIEMDIMSGTERKRQL